MIIKLQYWIELKQCHIILQKKAIALQNFPGSQVSYFIVFVPIIFVQNVVCFTFGITFFNIVIEW